MSSTVADNYERTRQEEASIAIAARHCLAVVPSSRHVRWLSPYHVTALAVVSTGIDKLDENSSNAIGYSTPHQLAGEPTLPCMYSVETGDATWGNAADTRQPEAAGEKHACARRLEGSPFRRATVGIGHLPGPGTRWQNKERKKESKTRRVSHLRRAEIRRDTARYSNYTRRDNGGAANQAQIGRADGQRDRTAGVGLVARATQNAYADAWPRAAYFLICRQSPVALHDALDGG